MNTDTLVETTWIKTPDKLHAVRFTDWQQADALRELLGASGFELIAHLSGDPEPVLQFHVVFYNDGDLRSDKHGTELLNQGDYLVTEYEVATEGDPPRPAEDQSVREWRIMTAKELQAEHQRYRPIR